MPTPSASELSIAEAAHRFRHDAEEALGGPLETVDCLALAISGGPDSMAMLGLATRALPCRIVAATVDHRLRDASAAEADMVAAHCRTNGIAHAVLPVSLDGAGNLHGNARAARYEALVRWAAAEGALALATAHHADDQAETFLMRAVRGAGIGGLAAVRRRGDYGGTTIVRPLLGWRRSDLRAIVTELQLPSVNDPSNDDPRYERTRVRALLAGTPWLDTAGLARTAAHVGDADRTLEALAEWLWETRCSQSGGQVTIDVNRLPREMRRRLARHAIEQVSGTPQDGSNVEHLLDSLEQGKRGTQAEVLGTPKGTVWRFQKAPPRRSL